MATVLGQKLALNGGEKSVTLPIAERWKKIQQEEIDLVVEMLKRGEISTPGGGVMEDTENDFAAYFGSKYCLSQCNGTSAMFSAYFACGVGPGDEVLIPSYTWHASVSPVVHSNGIPVFCEIDPKTLCVDPKDIERKITSRTKAISLTHIWGNPCEMDEIMAIAERHGLKVVEDASHAHGAEWGGKKIGTIGHVGVFSLQGSKPLAAGEGGIIITDDPELYDRILILGHQGRINNRTLQTEKYNHLAPQGYGYKFRANPLSMAIAKMQLKRIDKVNAMRQATWDKYDAGLRACKGVRVVEKYPKAKRGGFYEYRAIYSPEELGGLPLTNFRMALEAEGVPISPDRYQMNHLHPAFNTEDIYGKGCPLDCPHAVDRKIWEKGSLPVTEDIFPRLFSLPSYTDPTPGLLDQITQAFRKVTEHADEIKWP
jgi:perosamine synthetase